MNPVGSCFADFHAGETLRWKAADLRAAAFFKTTIAGKTPHDLFDKESADIFLEQIDKLAQSKNECTFEIRYAKGKHPKKLLVTLTPFVDASFHLQQIACAFSEMDISYADVPLQIAEEVPHTYIGDAGYRWNTQNDALHWSGNIESLLGASPVTLPTTRDAWLARIHPDDQSRIVLATERLFAKHGVLDEVYRVQRDDTTFLICRDIANGIRNPDGNISALHGSLINLTEQVTQEEALKHSLEKYTKLIEASSDIIIECDALGKILSVNPKGANHFGLTPEKMQHKWLDDFLYFRNGFNYTDWLARVTTKAQSNVELRTIRNGRLHAHVQCSTIPLWDETQKPTGFLVVAKDITHERQTFEEYRAVFEYSRDGIILFQNEKILRMNKAAARQFGASDPSGYIGRSIYDLVPQKQREAAQSLFSTPESTVDGGTSPSLRGIRSDGTQFDLEITVSVLSYQDAPIYMLITRDVTDRRVAFTLLKQSEEFFRALIEHSPDFIILTDGVGKTMYVNPAFTQIVGHDASFILGRLPVTLIHPKDRKRCFRALINVQKQKQPVALICRVASAQGEWIDFEALIVPLVGAHGEIDQFFISARDVSFRERAQVLVTEKERRFQALFQNAGDGLFVFNKKGEMVNINQLGSTMFGYPEDVLVGEDIRLFLFPEDAQHVSDPYLAAASTEPMERRLRKRNGEEIWVNWKTSIFEAEGELSLLVIMRDITLEHHMREELEYEHAFKEAVFQSLEPLRVINVDTWEVVSSNPRAEEYFAHRSMNTARNSCQQIGRKNVQCIDPECPIHFALQHDAPMPIERQIENEETWLWICGYPFTVSGHRYIAEMIRDITPQKRLEQNLAHAQKMEAIGTLAGGIAHDFNNLLGGIIGFTSLAKLKLDASNPLYRSIDSIEKSAQRAAKLTEQLLDFARAGRVQVEALQLAGIIESVLSLVERTFQKKIRLEKHIDPDLRQIDGDAGQIEHALLNLCINARDAIFTRGIEHADNLISISAMNADIDEDSHPVPANIPPGSYICITIKDTGIGMDSDVQTRIFEPFFTTKSDTKGTGLGLAMVYGIVKAHNGYIDVVSEPSLGSTFRIYFPALPDGAQSERQSVVQEFINGQGTILLADDEELMRDAAKEILETLGYTVLVASGGKQVLDIYAHAKNISCIILDVMMPEMNGIDVYAHLKKINPEIRVLFTSGYYPDPRAKKFIDSGEVEFLQKPYTVDALSDKLSAMLEC